MKSKKYIHIINPSIGGGKIDVCGCLKARDWKNSYANFIHQDGMKTTGIMEYYYEV